MKLVQKKALFTLENMERHKSRKHEENLAVLRKSQLIVKLFKTCNEHCPNCSLRARHSSVMFENFQNSNCTMFTQFTQCSAKVNLIPFIQVKDYGKKFATAISLNVTKRNLAAAIPLRLPAQTPIRPKLPNSLLRSTPPIWPLQKVQLCRKRKYLKRLC